MHLSSEDERRFWALVDKSGPTRPGMDTPCWLWRGQLRPGDGYGLFGFLGEQALAHRVSYVIQHGEIPDGMCVLHRCDYPPCVRHLFIGTQAENVADAVRKGRHSRGAKHSRAVAVAKQRASALTLSDVDEIRKLHSIGVTQKTIAEKYKLHQTTVSLIVRKKTWR